MTTRLKVVTAPSQETIMYITPRKTTNCNFRQNVLMSECLKGPVGLFCRD